MRRMAAIIPLLLATSLSAPAFADDALISVTGVGEVSAAPDTAYITSGVVTQGATAREALDANTTAMNELIAALKDVGIEARDIQTSGFSVSPNYVYSDTRDANGYQLPPKIAGYQVANNVNVRVRALDTLGTVLDKQVSVGANTAFGLSFSVADPSKLYDEARKAAFADAKSKAALYAEAAGEKLGSLKSVTEIQGGGTPVPYMMKTSAEVASAAPVPVAAGELSFSVNVQVTWSVDD
jgi:uncharacterized protein YggE